MKITIPLLTLQFIVASSSNPTSFFQHVVRDHTCKDKSQSCGDDQTCCPFGDGYGCCESTGVEGGPCCGEGCCTAMETCTCSCVRTLKNQTKQTQLNKQVVRTIKVKRAVCNKIRFVYRKLRVLQDPHDVVLDGTWTPKNTKIHIHTHTPQTQLFRTVGCETGSVGCCDPASPWQWNLASQRKMAQFDEVVEDFDTDLSSASDDVAYALMVSGSSRVAMSAWTIDMTSGKVLAKKSLSAFDDDPAGESTREFLWDNKRKLFYYFDANFTANGGARPENGREVYMYSVNPATGDVQKSVLQGATDFPTGYAMRSDGHVVIATEHFESNDKMTGFSFWDVDPESSKADLIGTNNRGTLSSKREKFTHETQTKLYFSLLTPGTTESDPNFYAGFHRSISADGTEVYRFGYELVTTQQNQGIAITKISSSDSVTTIWKDELSKDHDYFMTLNRYTTNSSSSSSSFISLAPSTSSSSRSLDLIQWNLDESVYNVVATFKNAHPPRVYGSGDLGYLADFVNGDKYAGLVVQDSDLPYGVGDRWAIAVGDLTSSDSFKVLPLEPRDIAAVLSVSGFGM